MPIPVGSGRHANASGGRWSANVVSIPGTGVVLLAVDCGAVDVTGSPVQAGAPTVVLTQPGSAAITVRQAAPNAARTRSGDDSITRKGQRQFFFHVFIGTAGQVDGHLVDDTTGESERRLVPTGHRRTTVAPDGDTGTGQAEGPRV